MDIAPKNLVFISMTNYAGGAENILAMLARITSSPIVFQKKVRASGLVLSPEIQAKFLTSKSLWLGFILLLKCLIKYRKGYTIVSTHPYLNAFLGLLKRIGFIKSSLIVRECTSVFTRFTGLKKLSYQIAYKLGYPAVNLIICQTDAMRKQLLDSNDFINSNRAVVIPNPIDLKSVFKRADANVTEDLDEVEYICSAGRLIPEKGFDVLIKAFAEIAPLNPALKLFILGEGKERQYLEDLIEELNLVNRVELKGHIKNPVPYFKKAKLCVVSSIKEGFPNVLLEMMAVNPHVVSTLCAGGIKDIPSIIKIQPGDIEALTEAMESGLEPRIYAAESVSEYLNNRSPEAFVATLSKYTEMLHEVKIVNMFTGKFYYLRSSALSNQ